jgi:hypothetical protein
MGILTPSYNQKSFFLTEKEREREERERERERENMLQLMILLCGLPE